MHATIAIVLIIKLFFVYYIGRYAVCAMIPLKPDHYTAIYCNSTGLYCRILTTVRAPLGRVRSRSDLRSIAIHNYPAPPIACVAGQMADRVWFNLRRR